MKRQDYVSWDADFMGVALLSAQRSKDNNTQVGSCIVNPHNKILSMGYNGMPTGCNDDRMPWERKGTPLDTKYLYVCHAELNAILNYSGGSLRGARIYTTLFPCNECTKAIIQAGITEVIYYSDKYADTDSTIAAKRMLDMVGITYRQYQKEGKLQEKEAQLSLSYHTIAADQASTRERVAVEAERETDDLKKCQYMLPFIGQPFQAHITGITSFGVFVGLENGIEGLVHISLLTDDDYEFDEASYTLRGQHGGKVYRLGDAMEVTLAQVNVEKCEIDFVPGRYESLDDVRNLMAASAERRHKRKSHDKKDTDTKRNWFAGAIGKKGKKDKKDKKSRKDKKAGRKAARKGKNTKRGKGRGKKKKK